MDQILGDPDARHERLSLDGKELFYMIGGNPRFRVADVTMQPTFAFGNPAPLPRPAFQQDSNNDVTRQYDIMPDGQHFIARIVAGSTKQTDTVGQTPQIQVVLNWFEELKQRVPVR